VKPAPSPVLELRLFELQRPRVFRDGADLGGVESACGVCVDFDPHRQGDAVGGGEVSQNLIYDLLEVGAVAVGAQFLLAK
jgi:hypothetical protein